MQIKLEIFITLGRVCSRGVRKTFLFKGGMDIEERQIGTL
jgi:hypothetical protein